MTAAPRIDVHRTRDPHGTALAAMRKAALEAAHTWSIRELVATVATRAPPRDYVAQLKAIYDEIISRWRYVMEPSEFVHGTARSLISHVLGAKYNAPGQDPTRVKLAEIPKTQKGWGDCDDVATAVAAMALAIGMPQVWFRIAIGNAGAHVSVLVKTPRGQLVSMDPVGHPDHGFGWAQPAPKVELVDVKSGTTTRMRGSQPMGGELGDGQQMQPETYFIGPGNTVTNGTTRSHWAATDLGDVDGPRSMTVPMRQWRMFRRGVVSDGCPGVDENGKTYKYCADRDLWVRNALNRVQRLQKPKQMGGILDEVEPVDYPLSGRASRKRRRAARSARRKKRRTRVRKFFKRMGKGFRKVMAKALKSKWLQNIIAGILQGYGVPMRLTRGVIAAGAEIIRRGGITGFIKLLRKDKRAAMKMIAAAGKAGLKGAGVDIDALKQRGIQKGREALQRRMSGPMGQPYGPLGGCVQMTGIAAMHDHDAQPMNVGTHYRIRQAPTNGQYSGEFSAAPIVSLNGAIGVIEATDTQIAATPTPGMYYRIQRGDSLLGTAKKAYGTSGGTNLKRAKWINFAKANSAFQIASDNKWFQPTILTYMPRFAESPGANVRGQPGNSYAIIWLPEAEGDEPPEIPWADPSIPVDIPDVEIPGTQGDGLEDDTVDPGTTDLPPTDQTDPGTGNNQIPDTVPAETDPPGDATDPVDTVEDPIIDDPPDTTVPDTQGGDKLVGPRGEQGLPGQRGLPGERGVPGDRGERGIPGVGEGVPGESGPIGPTGEAGAPGAQGVPGATGPRGPIGPAGAGGTGGGGTPPLAMLLFALVTGGVFK